MLLLVMITQWVLPSLHGAAGESLLLALPPGKSHAQFTLSLFHLLASSWFLAEYATEDFDPLVWAGLDQSLPFLLEEDCAAHVHSSVAEWGCAVLVSVCRGIDALGYVRTVCRGQWQFCLGDILGCGLHLADAGSWLEVALAVGSSWKDLVRRVWQYWAWVIHVEKDMLSVHTHTVLQACRHPQSCVVD